MKCVLIYSGGMDSTVLLHALVKEFKSSNIIAVSFDYKSKHNTNEFKSAKYFCKKLKVKHLIVDISEISKYLKSDLLKNGGDIPEGHYEEKTMIKTVVPFRNGIMLSIACGIAESNGFNFVAIGNHAGDHAVYPDCRETFIESMNEAMAYGTYNGINIISPFKSKTKANIVEAGKVLGVEFDKTYSCYRGQKVQCGRCSTCFERREAFLLASVRDKTVYKDKTPIKKLIKEYSKNLDKK